MMFVGNMGALLAAVRVTLCDAARQHQDYRGTPQKARIIRLYQGIQGTPSTFAALHLLMHVLIWNFDMFASTFVAYSRVLVPFEPFASGSVCALLGKRAPTVGGSFRCPRTQKPKPRRLERAVRKKANNFCIDAENSRQRCAECTSCTKVPWFEFCFSQAAARLSKN